MRSLLLGYALALGAAPVSGPVSGQVLEWTLERGVTIGSVDDPVYGLSRVGGVLADAERVFVLQPQDGRVRVFSRSGEFVRDLGRPGAGPGELTRPNRMGWHGSRLWVTEPVSGRLTFFDVATGEAETIRYRANVPGSLHRWMPFAVLANGRFVASPEITGGHGGQATASEFAIIVTEPNGTLRDTLARRSFAGNLGKITAGIADGEIWVISLLPDHDLLSVAPNGSSIVLVKRRGWDGGTIPAEFEVTEIDLHGDTVYRRRIEYEPRRVPSDFFDDDIARSADGPGINNRRAHARALREFYEERRYFPPVTAVSMGGDGTTWVAGVDEDGEREWLVLDGAGSPIGRLRLPTTSYIAHANEAECWVVERDALDIPYVVQYDIVR
ncbi:6-bladed beta-propeller [Candidatus Palauibacter sp.]|uniref:6-bladed beta-propeller n=1 Tax=Candidatus Palauibacter sp. TaxID=3101350 RepID=UPI003B527E49